MYICIYIRTLVRSFWLVARSSCSGPVSPPAIASQTHRLRANRPFQILDLHRPSPRSDEVWCTSNQYETRFDSTCLHW